MEKREKEREDHVTDTSKGEEGWEERENHASMFTALQSALNGCALAFLSN